MTVQELIAKLLMMEPTATVVIEYDGGLYKVNNVKFSVIEDRNITYSTEKLHTRMVVEIQYDEYM